MQKPTTLADIAREAGINVSTASRALNGSYGVRRQLRDRVLAIAGRLNYQPNLVARGLVTGRSQTLGLLISDIRNPFFAEVVRGAEDAANSAGYGILLCNSDLDGRKQMNYFTSLLRKSVDGIVMNSVAALGSDEQKQLAGSGVPIVLLQEAPRQRNFSTVVPDNFHGGYLAGSYLARLGHRNVAHLTAQQRLGNLAQRARGFIKGIRSVRPGTSPIILTGPHSFQGGYEMTKKLLAQRQGITAIFGANDVIALGAIRALREAGLRIPDDISLMGFDDIEFSSIANPALTSIALPKYEIGRSAVEILVKLANDKEAPPEQRTFNVKLVERDSCRAEPKPR